MAPRLGAKPSGNRNDPQPGTVFSDALAAGFKQTTIWRAADELGVRKEKEAFSKRWMWSLPDFGETESGETGESEPGFAEFDAFGEEEF